MNKIKLCRDGVEIGDPSGIKTMADLLRQAAMQEDFFRIQAEAQEKEQQELAEGIALAFKAFVLAQLPEPLHEYATTTYIPAQVGRGVASSEHDPYIEFRLPQLAPIRILYRSYGVLGEEDDYDAWFAQWDFNGFAIGEAYADFEAGEISYRYKADYATDLLAVLMRAEECFEGGFAAQTQLQTRQTEQAKPETSKEVDWLEEAIGLLRNTDEEYHKGEVWHERMDSIQASALVAIAQELREMNGSMSLEESARIWGKNIQ